VRRLDRLIGILELAHRAELQEVREQIRSDETYVEILDLTVDETPAGALSKAVQKKTGQSPKTVQRRITDLIELRALERTGVAAGTKYKATGLI
jgi:CTP-dependent riboflavin kinase